MLVNIGKRIKIESGRFRFSCDCATPGAVQVDSDRGSIVLPGNEKEALRFVAAYLRCVREPIDYVSSEVEDGSAVELQLPPEQCPGCGSTSRVPKIPCAHPWHDEILP
jgi:ribosomal protein L6P/L9E